MGGHWLPLHISIPSMVEQCGYNPAKYNAHIGAATVCTVAARAGLPTDIIQKLARWRNKAYHVLVQPKHM